MAPIGVGIEDGDDGNYVIENGAGEIGYLPKTASPLLDNARWAIAVFSHAEYDDNYEEKTAIVDLYVQENLL